MGDNEIIRKTVEDIKTLCSPLGIILVSNKVNTEGELVSFKLVVIVSDETESRPELECRLYMQIDCDIPYDIVIYKKSAWKIHNTGAYIYGEKL